MCGIVGLFLKNETLESELGRLFSPMLIAMTDRGPDSAGIAVYGDEVETDSVKMTLQSKDDSFDWNHLADQLKAHFTANVAFSTNANYAVFKIKAKEAVVRHYIQSHFSMLVIRSAGQSIEILKEVGTPTEFVQRYNISEFKGTHIIGHTRMATESAVTTSGSHPFSTGMDLCLVHNGSFSNHNRLRQKLKREGIEIQTENDSEVAAGYLNWKMREGSTLSEALNGVLKDLDGFYTLAIGTRNGFAVLRDPIACKPAILAETDNYVAMASEYRSLADLPGIDDAKLWEPEPGEVYIWEN
jgi:methylamine---glutamate N-methyltransferase subunit A